MMDEDVLGLEDNRKKSAKRGRRAQKAPEPDPTPAEDVGGAEEETIGNDMKTLPQSDGPPKPSRRMRGWGENSARNRGDDPFEDERLRPRTPEDDDDDPGANIPVIPDLEEAQEDDLTTQVAVAPTVAVNRVATYRELDNDLLRHAALLTLDNEIDLKVLTKCLSSEADIAEEDKPWDWDRLFTEVTSELLTEWEKDEGPAEQEAGM